MEDRSGHHSAVGMNSNPCGHRVASPNVSGKRAILAGFRRRILMRQLRTILGIFSALVVSVTLAACQSQPPAAPAANPPAANPAPTSAVSANQPTPAAVTSRTGGSLIVGLDQEP